MNLKSMKKTGNRSAERESWFKKHKFGIIMTIEVIIFIILAIKIR